MNHAWRNLTVPGREPDPGGRVAHGIFITCSAFRAQRLAGVADTRKTLRAIPGRRTGANGRYG
jgi:hypothetical protein